MEDFSFKNLKVWSRSMDFTVKCFVSTESFEGHFRIKEQLESSSASVAQNISEGKERVSVKENIQYLYFSRASLNEAVTILNILERKRFISQNL